MNKLSHILISRTDAIGDVVLTLPVAGYLKELFPGIRVSFLGKAYTGPVIKCSAYVDEYIDYTDLLTMAADEQVSILKSKNIDAVVHVFPNKHVAHLVKKAGIKLRIGTTNRVFHWFTCNKLVKLSRKRSDLHEAQLNLILLKPLGLKLVPTLKEIVAHNLFKPTVPLPETLASLLSTSKRNVIFHPRSNGSGAEWSLEKFKQLAAILPQDKFLIFITGSEKESVLLKEWLKTLPSNVTNVTGQMSLDELIAFISKVDGLVASGTGPLHLAAALGINTIGLFPAKRPIHAGRWAPLGKKVSVIESEGDTLDSIQVDTVSENITSWL
ncbi:glycosyltransferase family 9 protein [Mucilaginibacter terrenus]|uniref:glycosyltransferase family 9 protein n=1 Tax=Mucilaginibacter terrenus TaxID=2482727 RepID=UPI001F2C2BCD|nr:glycosyltransferase family 9 protein [Mucilaginibacter terrenus]